jgi:DNA invertase Pin-like site-specific DNA recombinase
MEVLEFFEERGLTGRSEWEDREAWMDMIGKLNGTNTIIVENLGRLARDLIVQELIMRDLTKRNVRLISAAGEDTDSKDPTRVLMRQIIGSFHQYECAMLTAKMRGAKERIRARGERCEGQKRYGHYPGEAEQLARIRHYAASNWTPTEIAGALDRTGYKPRTGKRWNPFCVSKILAAQKTAGG